MTKTGILLINLGTPTSATKRSVRRYLREFLSDPYVIDIPALLRWILLQGIILPFRTKQSTEAYQKIWTEQGSPLLVNSMKLTEKLRHELGGNYCVELGMRYGEPSIDSAVKKLLAENPKAIKIIPLYPQYAESTTLSSLKHAKNLIPSSIPVTVLTEFYDNEDYIAAKSKLIRDALKNKVIDTLIFSYHGLPERHIHKVCKEKQHCNLKTPCPKMMMSNEHCYRAQCYATSQKIAKTLGLSSNDYTVCFQSRLGKTPWINPYTDSTLNRLAQEGKKNIAIVCPSFVADCLETLEEIDIRAKEQWKQLGGDEFIRIPCLNDHAEWTSALAKIAQKSHPDNLLDIL